MTVYCIKDWAGKIRKPVFVKKGVRWRRQEKRDYMSVFIECTQLRNERSALEQTLSLLGEEMGRSCGHDSDNDGREGANGTQRVPGSSIAAAIAARGI